MQYRSTSNDAQRFTVTFDLEIQIECVIERNVEEMRFSLGLNTAGS